MHKGLEIGRFSNFQFPNENRQNNSLWGVGDAAVRRRDGSTDGRQI